MSQCRWSEHFFTTGDRAAAVVAPNRYILHFPGCSAPPRTPPFPLPNFGRVDFLFCRDLIARSQLCDLVRTHLAPLLLLLHHRRLSSSSSSSPKEGNNHLVVLPPLSGVEDVGWLLRAGASLGRSFPPEPHQENPNVFFFCCCCCLFVFLFYFA